MKMKTHQTVANLELRRLIGTAAVSEETLARQMGVSQRQVREWLCELVALGYVRVVKGAAGQPDQYQLFA